MDRVSVSSLNGPLSVDSPQTMTVMRRGNRSLRRRSLCSTARALAALAISLRQKSDATPLAQWSVNRKDPWAFVENVLPVENWRPPHAQWITLTMPHAAASGSRHPFPNSLHIGQITNGSIAEETARLVQLIL